MWKFCFTKTTESSVNGANGRHYVLSFTDEELSSSLASPGSSSDISSPPLSMFLLSIIRVLSGIGLSFITLSVISTNTGYGRAWVPFSVVIVTMSLDPERAVCPDPALKSPIEIYLGWDVFKSLGQNGCWAGGVIYCGSDLCCDRHWEN